MAAVFRASTVHKKQCVLSELHLRKHLGTGQGPAAERSCHWGAQSHWCASVQRPCKSTTKEPKNPQGHINTNRKKEGTTRRHSTKHIPTTLERKVSVSKWQIMPRKTVCFGHLLRNSRAFSVSEKMFVWLRKLLAPPFFLSFSLTSSNVCSHEV